MAGVILLVVNVCRALSRHHGIDPMPLFIAEVLLNALLFLWYYRNVFRNPNVSNDRRDTWSILTFMGGPVGQIVYLYRYVKRPQRATNASES
jgi:hypothetical protein